MKLINSAQITNTTAATSGYSHIFDGGDGEEIIEVSEPRLSTPDAARQRAYAELLEAGYEKTELTIDTPFRAHIGINSVIRVTALSKGIPRRAGADRFLAKEVEIKGDANTIIMSLKVERYD